jgi:hypothetical protein
MTHLDIAIWMNEIVQTENRPFSYIDFVPHFTEFGQDWSIGYGTFRNKISSLVDRGGSTLYTILLRHFIQ